MLGIGAIEIVEATYSFDSGHIVIRINKSGNRYRVESTTLDSWQVSESVGSEWTQSKLMQSEEFIKLLPEDKGWSHKTFVAIWAGFAAGYEKGENEGRRNERDRQKSLRGVRKQEDKKKTTTLTL
jgi:uncharacterized protein YfiM (DUF2279 family)